uniref:ANK_REP_REGION domain-containing protein n=1 Tax=Elaeophora elaphi TaxID=1147741 RepID=A0A158Q798_9BILA
MATDSKTEELFSLLENGQLRSANLAKQDFITLRNADNENVLIVAARTGQADIVRDFVSDFDLEDTDADGWTALLDAAYMGHEEIVKILLEAGAVVDYSDMLGWSPLMWAVYKNHYACAQLLIQYKAHVNLIDEEDSLTPLIVAAGRGYINFVELLIGAGAEVNACDKFGSTALIWAARKGYKPIIELLLDAGAELDAVGMYGSTALMMATRGNFTGVVRLILSREPNINTVDQNGLSPLAIAAREGYMEIASMFIQLGAYVNAVDRFGNSILAGAVRSGNVEIVKMLLDKHADVNARDSENRTALHLAIDKSFMDIAVALLERKPNLEIRNKDGDTPLLRAVKNRNIGFCQLLVNSGAKVSATDNAGDNVLHIALRTRSRKITQCLLLNPSDSRLLYRPNKLGQTPYSIDQENPQPIIPLIYGPLDAEIQVDAMLGYDIYSNVLADIVCEPNLTLPLTIGLYAKWGSGKSVLLNKMKDSMRSFSRSWLDAVQLSWSWSLIFSIALLVAMSTLISITAVAFLQNLYYIIIVGASGLLFFILWMLLYGFIYYGNSIKGWNKSANIAHSIAKFLAHMRLLSNVALQHSASARNKDVLSCPVSFLFADYHRLSSVGGEQALAKIVTTLFEAAENHFGSLPVRLFCALRVSFAHGNKSKTRRACGVPVTMMVSLFLFSINAALILLGLWFYDGMLHSGYLFGFTSFFIVAVVLTLYPLYLLFVYGFVNMPKKRINIAAQKITKLHFEGFMQKLQHEVNLLANMIRSLDFFTNSQTRLIVVVDGLDNCEQERMVQTLDALELLFCTHADRPFVVTIAVDPHIIISAVNHSMHSALAGTELTGHDYLKNIINMPFYLHNSAIRQLQTNLRIKRESLAEWKERFKRQDTFHGSYISLREGIEGKLSRKMTVVGTRGLSHSLIADDYFSNMNPRSMKRIVNALTLTGRLMRAFEIEFSWVSLGYWVSLIEQWPSRMCWLIDHALDIPQDSYPLAELYNHLKQQIPKKDPLIDLDRNPDNFESFLEQACMTGPDQLTVGHVRRFVPCTSNLDPYLRKLIRECRNGTAEPIKSFASRPPSVPGLVISDPAWHLFKDKNTWREIEVPLVEMKLSDVTDLVKKLDISSERISVIVEKMNASNLTGLVLSACDLPEVQETLKLNLGDWTLLKLLIETLRTWKPMMFLDIVETPSLMSPIPAPAISTSLNSVQEQKDRLVLQTEVQGDHQWILESFSGMDVAEVDDTHPASSAPSVHFDDGIASERDSTESVCGSYENLLESESALQTRNENVNVMTKRARYGLRYTREELMNTVRMDSVHSDMNHAGTRSRSVSRTHLPVILDISDNQETVREVSPSKRLSVLGVFNDEHGNSSETTAMGDQL